MSRKHKVFDSSKAYFITSSIVKWVKVFNDPAIMKILLDTIGFYQINKGFEIYSYCLMPDHFHMLCRSSNQSTLPMIMRDLKKYTSRMIISELESKRQQWATESLEIFKIVNRNSKREHVYSVWQRGYNPIECTSNKFIDQKMKYIHNNPVEAGLVSVADEYPYSSAQDYVGIQGPLEVILVSASKWETY